jgi:hypothetical protein
VSPKITRYMSLNSSQEPRVIFSVQRSDKKVENGFSLEER